MRWNRTFFVGCLVGIASLAIVTAVAEARPHRHHFHAHKSGGPTVNNTYGRFLVPNSRVHINFKFINNQVALPWKISPIPIQTHQPYLTQERTLLSLAIPFIVQLSAGKPLNASTPPIVFLDIYVNRQLAYTKKLETDTLEFSPSLSWILIGVATVEFQQNFPLPNPCELAIGWHGLMAESTSAENAEGELIFYTNEEFIPVSQVVPGQGSFFYAEHLVGEQE